MTNRSMDTSLALTEIRTVRNRAESAIENLQGDTERETIPAHMEGDEYISGYTYKYRDADADEMIRLLREFVDSTACFAKAGRRHSRNKGGGN